MLKIRTPWGGLLLARPSQGCGITTPARNVQQQRGAVRDGTVDSCDGRSPRPRERHRPILSIPCPPRTTVVDRLMTDHPFHYPSAWEDHFFDAMCWSVDHHITHCEFYKALCQHKGFDRSRLRSFEDIWDIPFIMTDVLKTYRLETRTEDPRRWEVTSSGTSGRPSRVVLDTVSSQRLLYAMYTIYRALGLADPERPANYLMMTFHPAIGQTLGTTLSDLVVAFLTPQRHVFYALDKDARGTIRFRLEEAVEQLRAFVQEGYPIRLLGFLHHTCEMIRLYRARYGKVVFPEHSAILSGGGWKGFADQ